MRETYFLCFWALANIRGPFETGWGAVDYTPQEARRILLTVPDVQ